MHIKEKFLDDLRKSKELYTGEELAKSLHNLRKRLDDPHVLCGEVVLSMLISFRDIQVRSVSIFLFCFIVLSSFIIFLYDTCHQS